MGVFVFAGPHELLLDNPVKLPRSASGSLIFVSKLGVLALRGMVGVGTLEGSFWFIMESQLPIRASPSAFVGMMVAKLPKLAELEMLVGAAELPVNGSKGSRVKNGLAVAGFEDPLVSFIRDPLDGTLNKSWSNSLPLLEGADRLSKSTPEVAAAFGALTPPRFNKSTFGICKKFRKIYFFLFILNNYQ